MSLSQVDEIMGNPNLPPEARERFISDLVDNFINIAIKYPGTEIKYARKCSEALQPYILAANYNDLKNEFITIGAELIVMEGPLAKFYKKSFSEILAFQSPHNMNDELISIFILHHYFDRLMEDPQFEPSIDQTISYISDLSDSVNKVEQQRPNLKDYNNKLNTLLDSRLDFSTPGKFEIMRAAEHENVVSNPSTARNLIMDVIYAPPEQKPEKIQRIVNKYELFMLKEELREVKETIEALEETQEEFDGLRPLPLMAVESFLGEDTRVRVHHSSHQ